MPTLHIDGLHCIKKRDPVGKDEIDIYVSIDGRSEDHLSGPHFIDKSRNDDFVDLHEDSIFKNEIVIRLKERNGTLGGNNDKDLGRHEIENHELSDGTSHTFGFDGVSYALDYRVT